MGKCCSSSPRKRDDSLLVGKSWFRRNKVVLPAVVLLVLLLSMPFHMAAAMAMDMGGCDMGGHGSGGCNMGDHGSGDHNMDDEKSGGCGMAEHNMSEQDGSGHGMSGQGSGECGMSQHNADSQNIGAHTMAGNSIGEKKSSEDSMTGHSSTGCGGSTETEQSMSTSNSASSSLTEASSSGDLASSKNAVELGDSPVSEGTAESGAEMQDRSGGGSEGEYVASVETYVEPPTITESLSEDIGMEISSSQESIKIEKASATSSKASTIKASYSASCACGGIGCPCTPGTPYVEANDKPWIAADKRTNGTGAGYVYVTWTSFVDTNGDGSWDTSHILFSRSTDNGTSFSAPIQVSDAGNYDNQFSQVAVGPNGEVYVSWVNWNGTTTRILFDKSTNISTPTFGTDIVVQSFDEIPDLAYVLRTPNVISMAVDRSGGAYNGSIYIVYPHDPPGADASDINFTHSIDGGTSWSVPKRLNNDTTTNDQFFPAIVVDPAGNITVVWYDRQDDPANRNITVYMTQSFDGGSSFTGNIGISDVSFDPAYMFIGDYIDIDASTNGIHPIWTDRRNGNNDVFTDLNGTDVNLYVDSYDQDEPTIAVNPTNSSNLAAGSHDESAAKPAGTTLWAVTYRSLDGGLTWSRSYIPRAGPLATFARAGDPVVDFDDFGNVYYAGIAFDNATYDDLSVWVAKSVDGGLNYSTPVMVDPGTGSLTWMPCGGAVLQPCTCGAVNCPCPPDGLVCPLGPGIPWMPCGGAQACGCGLADCSCGPDCPNAPNWPCGGVAVNDPCNCNGAGCPCAPQVECVNGQPGNWIPCGGAIAQPCTCGGFGCVCAPDGLVCPAGPGVPWMPCGGEIACDCNAVNCVGVCVDICPTSPVWPCGGSQPCGCPWADCNCGLDCPNAPNWPCLGNSVNDPCNCPLADCQCAPQVECVNGVPGNFLGACNGNSVNDPCNCGLNDCSCADQVDCVNGVPGNNQPCGGATVNDTCDCGGVDCPCGFEVDCINGIDNYMPCFGAIDCFCGLNDCTCGLSCLDAIGWPCSGATTEDWCDCGWNDCTCGSETDCLFGIDDYMPCLGLTSDDSCDCGGFDCPCGSETDCLFGIDDYMPCTGDLVVCACGGVGCLCTGVLTCSLAVPAPIGACGGTLVADPCDCGLNDCTCGSELDCTVHPVDDYMPCLELTSNDWCGCGGDLCPCDFEVDCINGIDDFMPCSGATPWHCICPGADCQCPPTAPICKSIIDFYMPCGGATVPCGCGVVPCPCPDLCVNNTGWQCFAPTHCSCPLPDCTCPPICLGPGIMDFYRPCGEATSQDWCDCPWKHYGCPCGFEVDCLNGINDYMPCGGLYCPPVGGIAVPISNINVPDNKLRPLTSWITRILALSTAFAAASIATLYKRKRKARRASQ